MIILGIVGSPAGGKSTVAGHLQGLGATWINADQIARGVLEEDAIQKRLIGHFGSEIADSGGRIDRTKLASCVFGDDEAKRVALTYLEGVIHPRTRLIITDQLRALERQGIGVAVLDVPLLFEGGWDRWCDEIWCVDSDRPLRLARAKQRGWDDAQLQAREASQVAISEKRRLSTVILDNNDTLAHLRESIDQQWGLLIQRQNETPDVLERHCLEDDRPSN